MNKVPKVKNKNKFNTDKIPTSTATIDTLHHLAFHNSLQATFITGVTSKKIITANKAFCKLLGYSRRELLTKNRVTVFNADGASELLKSWLVNVTDEQGNVQHYGPYTKDQASVSGKTILGNNTQGNYKIVMTGETKTGHSVTKESSVSLMKMDDPKQEGLRYSILFDFDRSKSIASYEKFLTKIVTPLISENGTVIIHGHTDIIGEETYNHTLSHERATGAQQIIEHALSNAGKKGVKFETYGFGEDTGMAPFENSLPEERFYNRTVIIDIIPAK